MGREISAYGHRHRQRLGLPPDGGFRRGIARGRIERKGAGYVIVNEAGASVYSTSRLGREEFPHYDALLRGAISIGRPAGPIERTGQDRPGEHWRWVVPARCQGQDLHESLDEVVESCVNYVGVEDLNTASPALLAYVSGPDDSPPAGCTNTACRTGPSARGNSSRRCPASARPRLFRPGGFLKIVGGDNPLDASWIHPESYEIASRVMEKLGCSTGDLANRELAPTLAERIAKVDATALAGDFRWA